MCVLCSTKSQYKGLDFNLCNLYTLVFSTVFPPVRDVAKGWGVRHRRLSPPPPYKILSAHQDFLRKKCDHPSESLKIRQLLFSWSANFKIFSRLGPTSSPPFNLVRRRPCYLHHYQYNSFANFQFIFILFSFHYDVSDAHGSMMDTILDKKHFITATSNLLTESLHFPLLYYSCQQSVYPTS